MAKIYKGIPYTGTLPAVLTGTKAGYLHRYKIYGNMEQTGTPTPENPIEPSECGELETTGVHAGQYKFPLTSAGQNVNIYIDEPLRKIGEYADYIDYGTGKIVRYASRKVFTGNETFRISTTDPSGEWIYVYDSSIKYSADSSTLSSFCSHYPASQTTAAAMPVGTEKVGAINNNSAFVFKRPKGETIQTFQSFVAAQYANGTPVEVWYPLRTIVEEDPPVPFSQIPTSANSTTISWAGSGLAPSQFDSIAEWVSAVPKIYTNGVWEDAQTYTYTNGEWVADTQ